MRPIGSDSVLPIRVYVRDRPKDIFGRVDVFGSDIAVVTRPSEFSGFIAVPRWEEVLDELIANRRRYRWKPEHLRFQLVDGSYKAFRQVLAVLAQYGLTLGQGEKLTILEVRNLAQALNRAVVGLRWNNADEYAARLRPIARQILRKPGMQRPRSLPKREILEILDRMSDARDRLGRPNEGALLAQTLKLMDLTEERLMQAIMRIEPVVAMREKVFLNLICWANYVFGRLTDYLELVVQPSAFASADRRDVRRIHHYQLILAQELDGVDYRPYVVNARYISQELRAGAECLVAGSLAEYRQLASRSLMSARLKQAQIVIERVIYLMLRALLEKKRSFGWVTAERQLEHSLLLLRQIDETGFAQPVTADAISLVREAFAFVQARDRSMLSDARELLKQSSQKLTGNLTEMADRRTGHEDLPGPEAAARS